MITLFHDTDVVVFVQSLSCVQLFETPCTIASQASTSFTISWSLLQLMSIESVKLFNHLILCSPFLLLLSIFPSIRVFSKKSGGQSIWASASASVLPMNIQGRFTLLLTGLISLQSKGFSRVISNTTDEIHQFFSAQPSLWSNCHICTCLPEKPQLWLDGHLLAKTFTEFQRARPKRC